MTPPKVLGTAEFTRDMADTLVAFFDQYAVDGIVRIEVTDKGLWLQNPNGSCQFLGATNPLDKDGFH